MKSLTESPAVLTVHAGAEGQYILRIADLQYRPLLVSVSKMLPGARSLVVITPSDIKVFSVGGSNDNVETSGDDLRTTSGDVDSADVALDAKTLAAIEAENERPLPNATVEEEEPEPSPARTRRRPKPESVAGHDEPCGRCRGVGMVAIALDNGAPSETVCPICKGTKVMRRYGARR